MKNLVALLCVISTLFGTDRRILKSIMKGCANETMCGAKGSAKVESMEHIKYRFDTNCCTENLCNSDGYKFPLEDPTPNGVKCPTAYCMGNFLECKSDKEMNCTGSMDRCFEFISDVSDAEYLYDPGAKTSGRAEENSRKHQSFTMKNLAGLLCMISALVTVESLMCKSCLNRNGHSCNIEGSVDCGDGSSCCTVSGFTRFNSTTTQFIHKGCQHNLPSGQFLRIASEEFVCQSYVNCCEEDSCNSDYYIPVDSEKENGYVCPICYNDHDTKGCVAYKHEKCTGNATLCAEYIGTFFKPDGSASGTSFKSCANPSGFKNLGACFGIEEIERVQFQAIEATESPDN